MVARNGYGAHGQSTSPVPCTKPDMRLHKVVPKPTGRDRNAPRPEVTRWRTETGKVVEHDTTTNTKTCWFECSECAGWFRVQRPAAITAAWPSQCSQTCRDAAQRRSNREAKRRARAKARAGDYTIQAFDPADWEAPYEAAQLVVKRNSDASPEAKQAAQQFIDNHDFDPLVDQRGERVVWRDDFNVPAPPGVRTKGPDWTEPVPDTRSEEQIEAHFQALMTELRSKKR